MRIGFLCVVDPDEATPLSGMPYHMKKHLVQRGHEVVNICPLPDTWAAAQRAVKSEVGKLLPPTVKKATKDYLLPWVSSLLRLNQDPLAGLTGDDLTNGFLAYASKLSAELSAQIDPAAVDVLYGCCVSIPLYRLEVPRSLPIVYYSDTTARLINASYDDYKNRSPEYHAVTDRVERIAMARAAAVVTATELARRSAINDYGVAPERAHVVHMGANISHDEVAYVSPEPPTREGFKLVITAAKPARKRLDLAIDVVEILRDKGVAAELSFIGPPTPRAEASPWVHCAGFLKLSDPADRRQNLQLLAESHIMILPSTGEAFGIAPCEAAHVDRPSIVSAAGGLPEAVLHDQTGIVMPVDATAEDYARELLTLLDDPERYRRLSRDAGIRAREVLSWDHWAARLEEICSHAVASRREEHTKGRT